MHNLWLHEQFETRMRYMVKNKQYTTPIEVQLWHGTDVEFINLIARNGFTKLPFQFEKSIKHKKGKMREQDFLEYS